jgi:molybdopterin synthase sulfur carrier subunit
MLMGKLKVRAAINHELVHDAAAIKDGDEVAFFPPVTGG